MLDKKRISVIFLSEFKMGCKSMETTHNTNNTFGPGTANSGGLGSSAKEMRALRIRSTVAGHQK